MACCIFGSSSSSSSSSRIINNVRVVDLNGRVQEFDCSVLVSQVIGHQPRHFVYTASEILTGGLKPLRPETLLEPGRVYFLLPSSAFQLSDFSPLYLANIVKKLTAKAKSKNPEARSSPARTRSPLQAANDVETVSGKRSWRPALGTIRELSSKRCESDLQELHKLDPNS